MPQAGHLLKGQKGWYCEDEQEMRKQQKYSWLHIEHLAIFEFELIDVLMCALQLSNALHHKKIEFLIHMQ